MIVNIITIALLLVLIVLIYRQTKSEEEIQRELERHVIEHLKHNPGRPGRDSKGRFIKKDDV